jgi:hypothetical protein
MLSSQSKLHELKRMNHLKFLYLQSSYSAEKLVAEELATQIPSLLGLGLGDEIWLVDVEVGRGINGRPVVRSWHRRGVIFRMSERQTSQFMSDDFEVSCLYHASPCLRTRD